jgi:hypothetical protein
MVNDEYGFHVISGSNSTPAWPDARIVPGSIIDALAMIVMAHYHGTILI